MKTKYELSKIAKGTVAGMNCCRCGKSFDYEKHNGICPKCAAYNRPQGQTPYDYDVEKDISAHYGSMDDSRGIDASHARLHQMYDSAPAHQPEKQHAQYHRQYDNNYRHPNQPNPATAQNSARNAGANRVGQAQMQNGQPAYRMNQPSPAQNSGGVTGNRMYQMQGQGTVSGGMTYQTQGPGSVPNNGAYQMQGASGGPPKRNQGMSTAGKVIMIVIIINVISSIIFAFLQVLF